MSLFDHYVDSVTLTAGRDPLLRRTRTKSNPIWPVVYMLVVVAAVLVIVL